MDGEWFFSWVNWSSPPSSFHHQKWREKKSPVNLFFVYSFSHPSFFVLARILKPTPKRQKQWCHFLNPLLPPPPQQQRQCQHQHKRQLPVTHPRTAIQSFGQSSYSLSFSYVSGLVFSAFFTVGDHGGCSGSRDEGWAGTIRWGGGGGQTFVGMRSRVVIFGFFHGGKWEGGGGGRGTFGLVLGEGILRIIVSSRSLNCGYYLSQFLDNKKTMIQTFSSKESHFSA